MGSMINRLSWPVLHLWLLLVMSLTLRAHSDGSPETYVKFLRAPHAITNKNSATFAFQVLVGGGNGEICRDCSAVCKLDNHKPSDCEGREMSYKLLDDGDHTFEVCTNGSRGFSCGSYNWTVDTVPPTAYVTAMSSFTNASNVTININFSEPCNGGGGFGCADVNSCNLLVYGAGQIAPNTFRVLRPNLQFSLGVSLFTTTQYGRAILVMDKNFCTDAAGNEFIRTENSSLVIHFDRRSVLVNLRTHIPERLLQLDMETRTVLATNKNKNLKVYLYFTEPVVNSSAQILNSLSTSQGTLLPISGSSHGKRRFGFQVKDISQMAIVTVSFDSNLVISRQGTPVSPVTPVTFLYDSHRPAARLSTTSKMRTRENVVPVLIKFMKPVFGFNSSQLHISGGKVKSFQEVTRSSYVVNIHAEAETISVVVPENITADVAGNKNLASNILKVRHYTAPLISLVISSFATAAFAVTSLVAGLLTVSTASLISIGAFSRSSTFLTCDPTRSLFRMASHIQVFALSRWLAVTLPVEYYELSRGLQWSIPYLSLPWETDQRPVMVGSSSPTDAHSYASKFHDLRVYGGIQSGEKGLSRKSAIYGLPLTPMEYRSLFESQNFMPEAEFISDPQSGWRDFERNMFWLAVIGGSLILLHALVLIILKFRRKNIEKEKSYGTLVFPRFEIALLVLALPCLSQAAGVVINGGASSGVIVGFLLLSIVAVLLLVLFLFLSIGITLGKLLQYKEVHQEGQKFHWYQELIRVTLGPGKRGQWTWKKQPTNRYLIMFGPLFEDLRGPPQYMLSQFSGGSFSKHSDRIIASDDETEDAEAPFIQKLFGILRIYYTLLEAMKRVCLGFMAGAYIDNWSSRTPAITLLSISSFQLFFMVLKKPFIKKKVQLVEIISVSCEVGVFATCMVLSRREFSARDETRIGIFMVLLFLVSFLSQMINEWYALYRQTKLLDPTNNSFLFGLRTASIGFLLFFLPHRSTNNLESKFIEKSRESEGLTVPPNDRLRTSGSRSSGDRPWLQQLRELAKASFSREETAFPRDPSTSRATKWSGLWSTKRSGSSSANTSSDFKSKPRGLYKDLEAIFASK